MTLADPGATGITMPTESTVATAGAGELASDLQIFLLIEGQVE
jgi:hypothetical protein